MSLITIKRGDTLLITGVYKQSNGIVMDLTGYSLEVNIINSSDRVVSTIHTGFPSNNRAITIVSPTTGSFRLVVKDTEILKEDDYYIDFKAVGSDGYEQTSKALRLKVKNKLV